MTATRIALTAEARHSAQVEIRECVALMDQHPEQQRLYALLGVKSWTGVLLADLARTGAVASLTVAAADQYGAAAAAIEKWIELIVEAGPEAAVRGLADAFEDAA